MPTILQSGLGGYYRVTDQSEMATNANFCDRGSLAILMPDLLEHPALHFSAEDVRRFLGRKRRWMPMGKGVANFWRYWQLALQSNGRYLAALAHVEQKGEVVRTSDDLCRSRVKDGKRYARCNPVGAPAGNPFAAVLSGERAMTLVPEIATCEPISMIALPLTLPMPGNTAPVCPGSSSNCVAIVCWPKYRAHGYTGSRQRGIESCLRR